MLYILGIEREGDEDKDLEMEEETVALGREEHTEVKG